MKRIILHIGIPKTGSTALQSFLNQQADRNKLDKYSIGYYLPSRAYVPWGGYSNGDFVLAEALRRLGEPKDSEKRDFLLSNPSLDIVRLKLDEGLFEALNKEKELFSEYAKSYDNIVLSEEVLWHYELFYPEFWSTVREYLEECCGEDIEIDIVVYLRRQDKWILSKWKEDMRNEIPSPWDFYQTLAEYERIGWLDYYSSMKRIEEVFGKEHLIIRNYERQVLNNNDICYDFLSICGFNADDIMENYNEMKENLSINVEAALALCIINKEQVKKNKFSQRMNIYRAASHFSSIFQGGNQIQIIEERKELLKRYSGSNDAVTEAYLNGQPLFDNAFEEGVIVKPNTKRDRKNARFIKRRSMIIRLKRRIKNEKE